VKILELSNGWLESFLQRNHYCLRKVISKQTLSDGEIINRALCFIKNVKNLLKKFYIKLCVIWNINESAVFLEDSDTKTVDKIGSKRVCIKHAGFQN
jgi:hypothetical protein